MESKCHHFCKKCRTDFHHVIKNPSAPIDPFNRYCFSCGFTEAQKINEVGFKHGTKRLDAISAERRGGSERTFSPLIFPNGIALESFAVSLETFDAECSMQVL
jgi:hypothetical protein